MVVSLAVGPARRRRAGAGHVTTRPAAPPWQAGHLTPPAYQETSTSQPAGAAGAGGSLYCDSLPISPALSCAKGPEPDPPAPADPAAELAALTAQQVSLRC